MILVFSFLTLVIFPIVTTFTDPRQHITSIDNEQEHQKGLKEVEGEKCNRICHDKGERFRCHYNFTIESYYVLSQACFNCPYNIEDCYREDCVTADGHERSIVTANRKLPGPLIEVCRGDTIIVDVINRADPQATAIHWHGIRQRGTQYMDGVPMVTQCPIQPFDTFRYEFQVPDPGSYFYHSHISAQKADGLYGALIVRNPEDAKRHNYDCDLSEHVVMINDWYSESIIDLYARSIFYKISFQPYTILVNGKGRYVKFPKNGTTYQTPLAVFTVKHGKRYRFRVIGGNFECGIQVSIDNHVLEIISTDGKPVEHHVVDGVNILAGERYDFILDANKPVCNYWMKFRGLDGCDNRTVSAYQMAILRYEGAPKEDPEECPSYEQSVAKGYVLNPVIPDSRSWRGAITTLKCASKNDLITWTSEPNYQFVVEYDFRQLNDTIFNWPLNYHGHNKEFYHPSNPIPMLNYIVNSFPPSPLLSQYDSIPKNLICNAESLRKEGKDCTKELCLCTQLVKVPLNAVVQILLIDDGTYPNVHVDHPIHLHGYSFRVVAWGRFKEGNTTAEEIKKLAKENRLKVNLDRAVQKDTVNVPNGGYAVIRFYADSAGFWLLHCHIDVHLKMGMALTVQVGEIDDYPKPPKDFPKCANT